MQTWATLRQMGRDPNQSIDAWTAYWQSGRCASCFEGSEAEVQLTSHWNSLVDELEDGARVLDLATGNGTVARSCAARARMRRISLRIDAVDAARIDPPARVADPERLLQGVSFRGGVLLESLPFPDKSFDAVLSQFGFEYADEALAAAEAARVLAPAGRLQLIVHALDGAVSHDIRRRLERLHSVLEDHGPVALVLALARAAEAGDVAALNRNAAYLPAAADLLRRLAARPPPDDAALFYSSEFLQLWARRERYRPADLRRSIEEGWKNATGVAVRQEEMLRVARSAEDARRICSRLIGAGLIADSPQPVCDARGAQIAWLIGARKPPG